MKKYFQKRYTLAFFIGILAGIFGAIVKWGWEVPFPPRNPNVFLTSRCFRTCYST